ncbi:hypothetical protein KPH14_009975 [Odynerus spinipes]|uniref:Kinetochore protein Spc24 n=1 Tax=Odynerus spinipes TaxID=1348599 RepID=A0AAD9VSD4_9HYME|nr:hypothetical protein KPH14_009975 [Odynerus spinipes]
MDEIKSLQSKHDSVTTSQLEELVNKCGKQVFQVKQDELEKENEAKIERLIFELISMKENLHTEHQVLEQKNKELLKHNDVVVKLNAEHSKFIEECQNLEIKKNLLKTTKPNQQDQLLLEQGTKKLRLYKALTGIHWDYSTFKESIEGYVTNKSDYIHHFCFKKDEDPEELSNLLWNEIYLSIENMLSENNKENLAVLK